MIECSGALLLEIIATLSNHTILSICKTYNTDIPVRILSILIDDDILMCVSNYLYQIRKSCFYEILKYYKLVAKQNSRIYSATVRKFLSIQRT